MRPVAPRAPTRARAKVGANATRGEWHIVCSSAADVEDPEMTLDHRNLIVVGSALLGLVACEKKQAEQTQTTGATQPETTSAKPARTSPKAAMADPNDAVIDRITAARCEREMVCNRVGSGKKWADDAACRSDLRPSTHEDLREAECKMVLTDRVQSCIDAIRTENCDNVMEGTRHIEACRKDKLCKD
jgi:hypothetical protein